MAELCENRQPPVRREHKHHQARTVIGADNSQASGERAECDDPNVSIVNQLGVTPTTEDKHKPALLSHTATLISESTNQIPSQPGNNHDCGVEFSLYSDANHISHAALNVDLYSLTKDTGPPYYPIKLKPSTQHIARAGRNPHECLKCGQSFSSHADLYLHGKKLRHPPYGCGCGYSFPSYATLHRHFKEMEVIRYTCPYCQRHRGRNGFLSRCNLRRHIRDYHHVQTDDDPKDGAATPMSSIGLPLSIHAQDILATEGISHGPERNESIIQDEHYRHGTDYTYNNFQRPQEIDDTAIRICSANLAIVGVSNHLERADKGALKADLYQPPDHTRRGKPYQIPEAPCYFDDQPRGHHNPNVNVGSRVFTGINHAEDFLMTGHQSTSSIPSITKPEEVNESIDNDNNAFFGSMLHTLSESYKARAIIECSDSRSSTSAETSSLSPSSTSHSETVPASNITVSTPSSSTTSRGKRKAVDSGRQKNDDSDQDGDESKRQKQPSEPADLLYNRKLSCPFRKHDPSKYRLSNPHYQSCATGSWKDISHLKDSHIYRVHLARCSGCKQPIKTQPDFEQHRFEVASRTSNSACNTHEGLLEHEIIKIKTIKFRGIGKVASWEMLYKFLFPHTMPVPDPWYTSPCDSHCQSGHEDELRRMMPDEIAAFMELQFMALYNKISSNKPRILELLMTRLRKRHEGVISNMDSALTMEPTPERPHDSMEVDNGEGPSLE
ncbi:hypothetical protein BKA65DRAFT_107189 [Rhexocercosporidium sp. MPI-PUGE-AT-0058]|nr:hypothetical protein BKA65DRAFT_107189 [Rhexocercosporidium sp. MPI-PUGE-AT-0058]